MLQNSQASVHIIKQHKINNSERAFEVVKIFHFTLSLHYDLNYPHPSLWAMWVFSPLDISKYTHTFTHSQPLFYAFSSRKCSLHLHLTVTSLTLFPAHCAALKQSDTKWDREVRPYGTTFNWLWFCLELLGWNRLKSQINCLNLSLLHKFYKFYISDVFGSLERKWAWNIFTNMTIYESRRKGYVQSAVWNKNLNVS